MKIEDNRIVIDEKDLHRILPFNDETPRAGCYNRGMIDFAEAVKIKVDAARAARDQHSYMYHGAILNTLLDDLDRLTHNVLAFKSEVTDV